MIEQKVGTQGEGLGSVKKTPKIRMEKLFEQVKKCASNYPNIYKIVLFGSRARGDYRPSNSDIDLAIFSRSISNLEVANLRMGSEDLDTLLKFDIVLMTPDTDPRLLENVKQEGVVLMELLSNRVNLRKAVERLSEGIFRTSSQ